MIDVLLVEPDRVLGGIYERALKDAGHTVRIAGDAQNAVQMIDERRPDVVVCELILGEHNGVEFIYELRSYADWSDIPIIILTSVSPEDVGLNAKQQASLGVVDYLYKPQASLQQIVKSIQDVADAK